MKKLSAILVSLVLILSFSSYSNNLNQVGSKESSSEHLKLSLIVSEDVSSKGISSEENSLEPSSEATSSEPILSKTEKKINKTSKINSDVVGWIEINGTNIDYPVLQDPKGKINDVHELNLYYLNRNINKESDANGSIYADDWCVIGNRFELSRNTVIYGKNRTNNEIDGEQVYVARESDIMFAQLPSFSNYEFAKKTHVINFSTPTDDMTWVIFAVFYTDTAFNYILEQPSDMEFIGIVNGAKSRSQFNYDVDISLDDKILTLSTSTGRLGSTSDQRFVVMARLVRDGEDISKIAPPTINKNPKRPSWYTGDK